MIRFPLPASARIKKRKEFLDIQEHGTKIHSKHFLFIFRYTEAIESRIGITITRKVHKRAVQRNRLKRRIREIFRLQKHRLEKPVELVVIAKRGSTDLSYQEVEREILGALYRKKLLSDSEGANVSTTG